MATSRTTKITTKPKTNSDMENTVENKAKLFSQYYGQRVGVINGYTNAILVVSSYISNIDCLELTSLADISDEDAIEVVKACNGVLKRPNEEYDVFKNSFGKTVVGVVGGDFNNRYMIDEALPSEAIDKARELGYAYNWNGLSVEEQISRGWVRIKSKN